MDDTCPHHKSQFNVTESDLHQRMEKKQTEGEKFGQPSTSRKMAPIDTMRNFIIYFIYAFHST